MSENRPRVDTGKKSADRTTNRQQFVRNHEAIDWCKHDWQPASPNPYGFTHICTRCGKDGTNVCR